MDEQKLIESGLLEIYALGIASDEEQHLAETLLHSSDVARKELKSILHSLKVYSKAFKSSDHFLKLKNEISEKIEEENTLPLLNEYSTIDEWLGILEEKGIHFPNNAAPIYFREISAPAEIYTYVLKAQPGAIIPDETHDALDEYLLICSGSCEMVIHGKKTFHEAGSFIHVPPDVIHFGKVLGTEVLLAIGQRR